MAIGELETLLLDLLRLLREDRAQTSALWATIGTDRLKPLMAEYENNLIVFRQVLKHQFQDAEEALLEGRDPSQALRQLFKTCGKK